MKKLLLFFLFSGSLDSFCQEKIDTIHLGRLKLIFRNDTLYNQFVTPTNPDTLRATLIVYFDNGPAILHTKPGFVVMGKDIYLDDKKRVVKAPWVVYGYKLKQ